MNRKPFFAGILVWLCVPAWVYGAVAEDWEKHVISTQETPIYLYVADMDNDGDLDAVTTTNRHPGVYQSEVAWFRNNMDEGGQWDMFTISSSDAGDDPITNANGVVTADIDGDGNEDAVVGTGGVGSAASTGSVYWFKAPDTPDGAWQRFLVSFDEDNTYFKMYAMDVDQDGMEDIIAGGNGGTSIFINPGTPDAPGAQWERVQLPGVTGSSLYVDDLNGDGTADILNTHLGESAHDYEDGVVCWFDVKQSGGDVVLERTDIDDQPYKPFDINCLDINSDLRKDAVVSTFQGDEIYWYEAPFLSSGTWTKHILTDTFSGTDIYTGDVDSDGKADIIISGLFIGRISWFEAVSEQGEIIWTEHVLDDDIVFPGDISLDDLDGDGDLDVVLAGMGENQVVWYENNMPRQTVCPLEFILGEQSPHLASLRMIRDECVRPLPGGDALIYAYYAHAPRMVKFLMSLTELADSVRDYISLRLR